MADNMSQMVQHRVTRWWNNVKKRLHALRPGVGEEGISYIEIAFMMLIVSILIVSLTTAIQNASKGSLAAKERTRALALARDRLEEVKNMGYETLILKYSNYYYPDRTDAVDLLHQRKDVPPYPLVAPSAVEDPWTVENILQGNTSYWRHVVVKFVDEDPVTGQLRQSPLQDPPPPFTGSPTVIGGTDTGANLAYVEVAVTWFSRRSKKMEQARVSTLVASTSVPNVAIGSISGTVIDDNWDGNAADDGVTDDRAVTSAELIVLAVKDNGDVFSAKINNKGVYTISNVPDGSFTVHVNGAPQYRDSDYANNPDISSVGNPPKYLNISAANRTQKNINIYTFKNSTITVRGRYQGVPGTLFSPKIIQAACGLVTAPAETVTWMCDSTDPCWFQINGVPWPSTGTVTYSVIVSNRTDNSVATARICLDSSKIPATFYVGADPALYPGSNPCSAGCGAIVAGCVQPGATAYDPLDVSGVSTAALVKIVVMAYSNNKTDFLTATETPTGQVIMVNSATGESATLPVNSIGEVMFPVQAATAGTLQFTAMMTTTGYTADTYFLPFDVLPGTTVYLQEGGGLPIPDHEHTFVLNRVSAISGTVWRVADIEGYPYAQVNIRHATLGWSVITTADGQGRFFQSDVPVESTPYSVFPAVGSDFTCTPVSRSVPLSANGIEYRIDGVPQPLDFVLNAINGVIKGTVFHPVGTKVSTGAIVVARTCTAGAGCASPPASLPAIIPSPSLSDEYVYSTVTMTDGSFRLKVATGVGSYYLYSYVYTNGVLSASGPTVAVPVVADTEVTQNVSW